MQEALVRVEKTRRCRLAQALRSIVSEPKPSPPQHKAWHDAVELVDMHKVAPQSWFSIRELRCVCMADTILEALSMAHFL